MFNELLSVSGMDNDKITFDFQPNKMLQSSFRLFNKSAKPIIFKVDRQANWVGLDSTGLLFLITC